MRVARGQVLRSIRSVLISGVWLAVTAPVAICQLYPFLPVPGSPRGITALFQDSRGRLWLGGEQAAFFDGERFFSLKEHGLPAAAVHAFAEDSSGVIWIGAETGLYRFDKGKVEEIGRASVTSIVAISPDLIVTSVGPLGGGVPPTVSLARSRRAGGIWKTETIMPLDSPGPLNASAGGLLLFAIRSGGWSELQADELAHWHRGSILKQVRHPIPVGYYSMEAPVIRDRKGCVWVGPGTTYTCDGKSWQNAGLTQMNALRCSRTPDGELLVVGGNRLALGMPGSFQIAGTVNGLPPLLTAIEARDGTIWIGAIEGLIRFPSPFRLEYWTAREGVDAPWAVERNGADMYASLDHGVGLLTKDRRRWEQVALFDGQVTNLRTAPDGNILVALNPGGTALIARNGKILARTASRRFSFRLAVLPDGSTWSGGDDLGQMQRSGSRLNPVNHPLETQPGGNVMGLQYDDRGRRLWACYNGGLVFREDGGAWREITTKDGLLTNGCWGLAALPSGDVLYAYMNAPAIGLVHGDAGGHFSVRQFRKGDELVDPETLAFGLDRRGRVWRGGNHGVSIANTEQLEAGRWMYLDRTDGLPGDGMNTGSFFADGDGSVWFGSDLNVVHYRPGEDLVNPAFAPEIFLSSWSWDGVEGRFADAGDGVPFGKHAVAQAASLQFDRRNAIRLRYRILPEQTAWTETASLRIPLGALRSGPHTLELQGRLFSGPWSKPVSRTFAVLPPVWRSWPLLLAYVTGMCLTVASAWLLHRRRLREEAELLPDLRVWRAQALLPEVEAVRGTVLDERFEVGDLIGRGGFANVMAGYDRQQQRRCAIKVFRSELTNRDWVERGFREEVAALERVRHPNVVAVYAHGGTPAGSPYLVMEFVEGQSLRRLLSEERLTPARSANLIRQIAEALDAIHAKGICHRDVTPENVLVCGLTGPDEHVVLIDFSIAIVKDAEETLHGLSRAAGTFDYMAPEQAMGYAEPSSDIYSLAKVVIEMITGKQLKVLLPAASLDLPARVRDLLTEPGYDLSSDSINCLARALEFDPSKRPGNAGAFAKPIVDNLTRAR